MPAVKIHPFGEILSRKLFGFTTVPPQEQNRMVNRAIKAAMKEYDKLEAQNAKLAEALKEIVRRFDDAQCDFDGCAEIAENALKETP